MEDDARRDELTRPRRFGYLLLGGILAAMGFWIFPYQLERGDLLKTLVGAGLAILGGLVFVRALTGRRLRSLQKAIDLLSDLTG